MTWGLLVVGILLAGALVDYFMPSAVAERKTKAAFRWSVFKLSAGRRN